MDEAATTPSKNLAQHQKELGRSKVDERNKKRKVISMSKQSVFCIATSRGQADRIVGQLKTAKFSNHDISVLFLDNGTKHDFAHEKNTNAPEGPGASGGTGGVVAGALGWIAGIGELAIPGVGSFIAAGPIVAFLNGATVRGIAGGLVRLGIPESEGRRYEGKVKAGNFLISVHSDNWGEIPQAKGIFADAGAQDIWATGEVSVKDSLAPQGPARPSDAALSRR